MLRWVHIKDFASMWAVRLGFVLYVLGVVFAWIMSLGVIALLIYLVVS